MWSVTCAAPFVSRAIAQLSTVPNDRFDLVWDIVMPAVQKNEVAGHVFEGFWEDVGELDAYYQASRSLLPAASGYLWDRRWPLYTRSEERPPEPLTPPPSRR